MKEIILDKAYCVSVVPVVETYYNGDMGPFYHVAKWSDHGEKPMLEASRMIRPLGYFRDWTIVETWVEDEEIDFKTTVKTKLLKTRYFKSLI